GDAAAGAEAHPHEHRPALDVLEGDAPAQAAVPAPRVVAVVAVVAHHPDLLRGGVERALERPADAAAAGEPGAAVLGAGAGLLVGADVEEGEVGALVEELDVEL